jgi:hypothetical protein
MWVLRVPVAALKPVTNGPLHRRYKSFKVTALHPLSCLLFTVGFALREYGAFNYRHLNVYIASTSLIYMAPYGPRSAKQYITC